MELPVTATTLSTADRDLADGDTATANKLFHQYIEWLQYLSYDSLWCYMFCSMYVDILLRLCISRIKDLCRTVTYTCRPSSLYIIRVCLSLSVLLLLLLFYLLCCIGVSLKSRRMNEYPFLRTTHVRNAYRPNAVVKTFLWPSLRRTQILYRNC